MWQGSRRWGGLLGLGTINGSSAKADTTSGAAQQVDSKDVAATQESGTIPATSQSTSASTSTTTSTETTSTETTSTSTASESTTKSTDGTSVSTSTTEASTTSTKSTTTTSDATEQTSTAKTSTQGTSTSSKDTTATSTASDTTSTSTTSEDAASNSTTENSKLTSTSSDGTSASTSTTDTNTDTSLASASQVDPSTASANASASAETSLAEEQLYVEMDKIEENYGAATLSSLLGISRAAAIMPMALSLDTVSNPLSNPGTAINGDQDAYNLGVANAKAGIEYLISQFNITATSGQSNLILNYQPITNAITKISELLQDYQDDSSLQHDTGYAAPVWTDGNSDYQDHNSGETWDVTTGVWPFKTTTTYHTADYNQGYSDYIRDYASGLQDWLDGLTAKAADPDNAANMIDQNYTSSDLTGSSVAGTGLAFLNSISKVITGSSNYAQKVLGYTQDSSNTATADIATTVKAVTAFADILAPSIINGITHEAIGDIRSIGGSIDMDTYAPTTLKAAVALNGNLQTMVTMLGLSSLLTDNQGDLLNQIYNEAVT